MNNTQTHNTMKISVYNPTRNTRKAMNEATKNMGERFACMTRFNEETERVETIVYFADVHIGIVVPSIHIAAFMRHVQRNFFLAHERNIDWMNS